jgi:Zn-dependent protease/predicted transcriptional regulator
MFTRNAFRIGRLFGIELKVDSSWLFILVLVVWSLTSLFGAWHPDWMPLTSFLVAVLAALAFFASVLFHEMAHSLVARLYGVPVRDITLHMFGGVSNIEREPPTARAEFFIAIVGPIASIVLGLVMLLLGAAVTGVVASDVDNAAQIVARMDPLTTLLVWLGPVNVIVGVFNLVPGFPLDGGRILRAVLWSATGDLPRATRYATSAGQLVGWGLVFTGAAMAMGYHVPFFGRGLGSGLWLALIGFFLRGAARQQQLSSEINEALVGLRVADLMRTQGPVVDAATPLAALARGWFLRHDERAIPVLDAGAFVGVITITDLRSVPPELWSARTVHDAMTPLEALVVTTPDESASDALRKLGTAGMTQLPVIADGKLAGLLFERDIARWLELESHRPTLRTRHA